MIKGRGNSSLFQQVSSNQMKKAATRAHITQITSKGHILRHPLIINLAISSSVTYNDVKRRKNIIRSSSVDNQVTNTSSFQHIPVVSSKYRKFPANSGSFQQIPADFSKFPQFPANPGSFQQILAVLSKFRQFSANSGRF